MEESALKYTSPIAVAMIAESLLNGTEANMPKKLLQRLENDMTFKEEVLSIYFLAKTEQDQQKLQEHASVIDGQLHALLNRVIHLENYSYHRSLQVLQRSTHAQENAIKAQEKAWDLQKMMVLQSINILRVCRKKNAITEANRVQKVVQKWQIRVDQKLKKIGTKCNMEQKAKLKLAQFIKSVPTFQDLEQWTNILERYTYNFGNQLNTLKNIRLDVLEVGQYLKEVSLQLNALALPNIVLLLENLHKELGQVFQTITDREEDLQLLQEKTTLTIKVVKLKVAHYAKELLRKSA